MAYGLSGLAAAMSLATVGALSAKPREDEEDDLAKAAAEMAPAVEDSIRRVHQPEIVVEDQDIPRQLSVNARTAEFHNGISRVIGVRLDGVERTDVREYDLDRGVVTVRGRSDAFHPAKIEVYWREKPSRQVRRALRRGA